MRHIFIIMVILAIAMPLSNLNADPIYTIYDYTDAHWSNTNLSPGTWTDAVDVAGYPYFNTRYVKEIWKSNFLTFELYTEFDPAQGSPAKVIDGKFQVGSYWTNLADFAINVGGYNYGVILMSHNTWATPPIIPNNNVLPIGLYRDATWYTSSDFNWGGLIYDDWYAPRNSTHTPKKKPITTIKNGTLVNGGLLPTSKSDIVNGNIVNDPSYPGGSYNIWSFTIDASKIDGLTIGSNVPFFWGTGNCGNDPIENPVPEPGTLVLLVSGLLAIIGYGIKRKKIIKQM